MFHGYKILVANAMSMEVQGLAEPSSAGAPVARCTACDTLVSQVKEKFEDATYDEKMQLLTLLPASWTIEKTRAEMGVTDHVVNPSSVRWLILYTTAIVFAIFLNFSIKFYHII